MVIETERLILRPFKEGDESGGYRDPENDEYIYAEPQLYKDGLETNTLDEILEYINQERKKGFRYYSKYKSHDLVPSFYQVD